MKICLVTETFPPEVNGVAMTLSRLTRGLADRGHTVQVVRPRQGPDDKGNFNGPVQEIVVPGAGLPGYEGLHFGYPARRKLLKLWRENLPDRVHVATEGPLGWSAIRAARTLGIPLVSSFHTNFHSYGKHYGFDFSSLVRIALSWLRYVHNKTERTFVPSEDLRRTLEASGFRNTAILGRGVDTRLFTPERRSAELRRSWGAGDTTPVAIYVGRIAAEKNIPLTIEAYERMRQQLPDLKLVLVGDGPERKHLEQAHPDWIFAGMQRGEDLATHYASADIFLFASITETFGNVVTEAMASGLVVLAYDYAAPQRYIRDGINGRLAPYDNAQAFLKAAEELARNTDGWPALRKTARETALDISWDKVIDGYLLEIQAVADNTR